MPSAAGLGPLVLHQLIGNFCSVGTEASACSLLPGHQFPQLAQSSPSYRLIFLSPPASAHCTSEFRAPTPTANCIILFYASASKEPNEVRQNTIVTQVQIYPIGVQLAMKEAELLHIISEHPTLECGHTCLSRFFCKFQCRIGFIVTRVP
ncbi:hypothetical protein E5288_WYG018508 [Bos mutus]|uniref:Uncharacterized protein n=1 Tax=Bos mutus TaxID=72004 RepID=A0A6B0S0Z7_9CETA|nr:hypothetical protein [Bos mutus]